MIRFKQGNEDDATQNVFFSEVVAGRGPVIGFAILPLFSKLEPGLPLPLHQDFSFFPARERISWINGLPSQKFPCLCRRSSSARSDRIL